VQLLALVALAQPHPAHKPRVTRQQRHTALPLQSCDCCSQPFKTPAALAPSHAVGSSTHPPHPALLSWVKPAIACLRSLACMCSLACRGRVSLHVFLLECCYLISDVTIHFSGATSTLLGPCLEPMQLFTSNVLVSAREIIHTPAQQQPCAGMHLCAASSRPSGKPHCSSGSGSLHTPCRQQQPH
jgi:hypothetical protein